MNDLINNGFIVYKNFCTPEEIEILNNEAIAIENISSKLVNTEYFLGSKIVIPYNRKSESNAFLRAENLSFFSPGILKIATSERIKSILNILNNNNFNYQLIINQLNTKFPNDNILYDWHQDTQMEKGDWYSEEFKEKFLLFSIAITNSEAKNGCLKYIKNSHNFKNINQVNYKDSIDLIVNEGEILNLEQKAGDLVVFSPYLVHSSTINHSLEIRRLLLFGYCVDNTYIRSKSLFTPVTF